MERKIRVVLADSGEEYRMLLQDHLEQSGEIVVVESTPSGIAAWESIEQDLPDVVVLDLVLPELDGMALLGRIHALPCPPQVIVASSFFAGHIAEDARALGAYCFLAKPVDLSSLTEYICRCARPCAPSADADTPALEGRITAILHEIGVPAHLRGYHYLRQAILMAVRDPGAASAFTKILYPAVGKHFGSTGEQVERSIRTAIEQAWQRGDTDAQQRYFGSTLSAARGKPTSSELISQLSDYLRLQRSRCWG